MGFITRLAHGINAFARVEEEGPRRIDTGGEIAFRSSSRNRFNIAGDKSIVSAVYNRLGIDVAAIPIQHVKLDAFGRYSETVKSGLNSCLNLEANIDQAGSAFRQDIAQTLFEEGVCAIVPVVTTGEDPILSESYDVTNMRVGRIIGWFPKHVRVRVYDDRVGEHKELTLEKKIVAIVENPLSTVMNEPNGTLQRLIRKLALLDSVDEQASNGKLDLIVQLPYQIRTETKREMAEKRRKDLEAQLHDSKYGIGYLDATEKITQLNRPIENSMLSQIEFLTNELFGQLGITKAVMDGTADPAEMQNYHNRTVEPILRAITEALKRTFLSRTARAQGQSFESYIDPFKWVNISDMAEIADKFTRNEIMTSNEIRQKIGMQPAQDPKADQLINSNMPTEKAGALTDEAVSDPTAAPADAGAAEDDIVNSAFDKLDETINKILAENDVSG